ncbi:MAG: hypothetical protein WAT66_13845 [Actinomycetota bacterium]
MRKRVALLGVAAAAAVALLVPVSSSAQQAQPACVVVDGPGGLHLQIGYAPNGPDDCTHLP